VFTYCAPISVASFSSMVVNEASGVSERDDDAIFAVGYICCLRTIWGQKNSEVGRCGIVI